MPIDIAICIVIFVLIPGYPVYRFVTRKKRKLKRRRKYLHRMMEKCSNELKVSDLMKAYRENEITADEKYGGKIVCISGCITEITRIENEYTPGTTPVMSMYMLIESEYKPDTTPIMFISHTSVHVLCRMYKDDDEPLRDLRRGDEISVYGFVSEFSIDVGDKQGFVLLTSCVIPPGDPV